MKLQNLAILFILLIVPIALVMGAYIRGQGQTLTLQSKYDNALSSSTYDAISAYKINTHDNELVGNADSIREDIKAATNIFMMSMASELNVSQEDVKTYVPAILYSLSDGYYIYSAIKNDDGSIEYTLKPYVYYTEHIKKDGKYDIVINYNLDNYIAIYGTVNGYDADGDGSDDYFARAGYLIDIGKYKYDTTTNKLTYSIKEHDNVIEKEELKETLNIRVPIVEPDASGSNVQKYDYIQKELKYRYINQKKVYYLDEEIHGQKIDALGNREDYTYKKGWYTYSSTRGELIENSYNAGSYDNDDSAIKYYEDAYEFTSWLLNDKNTRPDGTAVPGLDLASKGGNELKFLTSIQGGSDNIKNDPENFSSEFCTHKRKIIRESIETNLQNAINNFSAMSQAVDSTYNYKMPILLEEDWEKIYTEVSMTTFFQGLPIGFKTYNNYSVTQITGNNQFVNTQLLYFINGDEYHKITCDKLSTTTGYRSTDFEEYKIQTSEGGSSLDSSEDDTKPAAYKYYFKHRNSGCYDCIIEDKSGSGVYGNDGYFSKKLSEPADSREEGNATAYFTTLARERYNQYRAIGYLENVFDAEGSIPVIDEDKLNYKLNVYVEGLYNYTCETEGLVDADRRKNELNENFNADRSWSSNIGEDNDETHTYTIKPKENASDNYYGTNLDSNGIKITFEYKTTAPNDIAVTVNCATDKSSTDRFGHYIYKCDIGSMNGKKREVNLHLYSTPKTKYQFVVRNVDEDDNPLDYYTYNINVNGVESNGVDIGALKGDYISSTYGFDSSSLSNSININPKNQNNSAYRKLESSNITVSIKETTDTVNHVRQGGIKWNIWKQG